MIQHKKSKNRKSQKLAKINKVIIHDIEKEDYFYFKNLIETYFMEEDFTFKNIDKISSLIKRCLKFLDEKINQ